MYNYFTNFPIISYNGTPTVNVLAKVKFTDIVKNMGVVFYPYTIAEGERPDIIAANYYDDPRYSWVIYLANDIVDPYYEWPMQESEFKQFILKKYGSLEKAYRQIVYWEDNWYEDDSTLSVSAFNALPSYARKYFSPVLGSNNVPINYVRNELNIAAESNMTLQLAVDSSTGFNIGDYVSQSTSGQLTASGFIKAIDYNNIVVQNVLGTFAATAGSVSALSSDTISTNLNTITTVNVAIPLEEIQYWTYVTAYDYETQLNDQKRYIRLIDKSFIDRIEKEISDIL